MHPVKKLRRYLTFLVALIIIFQALGAHVFLLSALQTLQSHNRNNTPSENALDLVMLPEEFQKARINAHEIMLGNTLYDIKECRMEGRNLHVKAVQDNAESDLLSELYGLFTQKNTDSNSPVISSLFVLSYFESNPLKLSACCFPETTFVFHSTATYPSGFDGLLSPPPRA